MSNSGIAVLISGRGSNLRAILQSPIGDEVCAVISDNSEAAGLELAAEHNKPAFIISVADFDSVEDFNEKFIELLQAIAPKIIALAGFMRILPPVIVGAFEGKMVNIHPSLLPQFAGLNTHARALAAGVDKHGCTVHWVNDTVDGGKIIAQREVAVLPDDNEEILAARVLEQEHLLYSQVLAKLLAD